MDNIEKPAKGEWRGAFAAYGAALKQIKANPAPAILYVGTYLTLSIIDWLVSGSAATRNDMFNLEDINTLIFMLALPIYALAVADHKHIGLREFMQFNAKKYFSIFAAGILYGLIIAVSALPLLIPLLWTIPWFALASYPIIDKHMGPIKALKESKRLVLAHRGKVWGLIGATILLILAVVPLAFIAPLFGNLVLEFLGVVSIASFALLYRWLQHNVPAK